MTLAAIKDMLTRRLARLGELRTSAESLGDLERVDQLTVEIEETQSTLDAIQPLLV